MLAAHSAGHLSAACHTDSCFIRLLLQLAAVLVPLALVLMAVPAVELLLGRRVRDSSQTLSTNPLSRVSASAGSAASAGVAAGPAASFPFVAAPGAIPGMPLPYLGSSLPGSPASSPGRFSQRHGVGGSPTGSPKQQQQQSVQEA